MKKTKIAVLPLLVVSTSFGALTLTGCGKKGGSYNPDNFIETPLAENPYQIVKEPITINIFTPHSSASPKTETLKMFKHLSKITNLNFTYNTPDTSAYQAQKATVWNGGSEMPDLFLFNNDISEIVQFDEFNFNAYTVLNDDNYTNSVTGLKYGNIIDKYMPNYAAGLKNNFNLDKETSGSASEIASLANGKMYSTLSVNDVPRDLTFKMYINKQWIEDLNTYEQDFIYNPLPLPEQITTLDDLYRVLKAFKDYDANGNGNPNDEIPISSASMKYIRNYFLSAWGHVVPGIEIRDDWSQYDFVASTPEYREYLKFCNKLYSEGIMDKKTFDMTSDIELVQRCYNKNIIGSFVHAAAYLCVGSEHQADYVTIKPVRAEGYNGPLHQWSFSSFKPDGATIAAQSAKTREVARLIDIMYSPLGQQLLCFGVEGEDWHWDDSSKQSWSVDLPQGYTADQTEEYRATLTPNVNSGAGLYWAKDFVHKQNDPITNQLNEFAALYEPYFKIPEPYEIKMTSTEYEQKATIKAGLDSRIDFNESLFIIGKSGYDPNNDADWNKYLAEIKNFKYEDEVKLYNQALNRYLENNK